MTIQRVVATETAGVTSTPRRRRLTLADVVLTLNPRCRSLHHGQALEALRSSAAFVVASGYLAGRLTLPRGHSTELIGRGDVVVLADPEDLPTEIVLEWTAIGSAQIAWLDRDACTALLRHAGCASALLVSQARRGEHSRAMHAVTTLRRVDDRVQGALWLLAERFGRVGREGTLIDVPLSHRLLGELIGARRPSVTSAITKLTGEGRVSRDSSGRWLLHGSAPEPRRAAFAAEY